MRGRGVVIVGCATACAAVMLAACALASPAAFAGTPGVAGWGAGAEGELGDGNNHNAAAFAPLSELSDVSSVAAGGNFGLALLSNGHVMSWGSDSEGQLGIGPGAEAQIPVQIPSLSGVSGVSAGDQQALAVLAGGTVERWGEGELTLPRASKPETLPGIDEAVAVAAGSEDRKSEHEWTDLALLADGDVMAWGNGEDGQLGDGATTNSAEPVLVKRLSNVTAVAAGDGQNLALLSNGTVMAWGENNTGQLGIGNLKDQDEPVAVPGLAGVVAISAGYQDSLALLSDGEVMAWGSDSNGALGRSEAEGNSDVPIPVAALSGVSAIAAGTRLGIDINSNHNLALLANGSVMAWGGDKEGELGNEQEGGSSFTPVEVSGLSQVTGISAGAADSFAVGPPVPIVESSSPASGPAGTLVHVTGKNLAAATSVQFGSTATNAIEEDTETSLTVLAPAEKPRTVSISVTTPFHTSASNAEARFKYLTTGTLELGRCLKRGKHEPSSYKKGCTVQSSGGGYEWSTEFVKRGVTFAGSGTPELGDSAGTLVLCKGGETGHGEIAAGGLSDLTLTLTDCAVAKSKHATKCNSPGAAEGELRTAPLEASVGFTNKEEDGVGLELLPSSGETFLTFACGASSTEVRGGVLGALSPVNSSTTSLKLNFGQSRGRQHLERFEGGSAEVLEASRGGGPFERVGLADTLKLTTEEGIEINSTR